MKAAIYARFSDHKQHETSIEDQIRYCQDEAARRGDVVVRVYEDRAKSGRDVENRPGFLRMMADAKEGYWQTLYVYKIDRFSRNVTNAAIHRKQLRDYGVRLISASEPSIEGPEAVIMDAVLDGFAAYWSLTMGQNIKRGMEGNALRCHHNGVALYGYDLCDDGSYSINESEASVIRECFERYRAGESTNDIVVAIEPHRTRRGNHWTVQSVTKMLHNEKYAGVYMFGGHRVEGGMPAIVSRELFDEVNGKMGRTRGRNQDFPLTGLVFDTDGRGFCGTSGTSKNGHRYYYYVVRETSTRFPKEYLEANVYGAVSSFLQSDGVEDRIVAGVLKAQEESGSDDDVRRDAIRQQLEDVKRQTNNLLGLAAKVGPTDQITGKLQELEEEYARLEGELIDLQVEHPRLTEDMVRFFVHKIITCDAPTESIRALVSRVVIDGDTMIVTFAIGDEGSDDSRRSPQDSENPSVFAGTDGCSHRYQMVDRWLVCTNTGSRLFLMIVGPTWFGFSVRMLPPTA